MYVLGTKRTKYGGIGGIVTSDTYIYIYNSNGPEPPLYTQNPLQIT